MIFDFSGEDHPDTLMSMNSLAELLKIQGKYDEAEPMSRKVLKMKEAKLGTD